MRNIRNYILIDQHNQLVQEVNQGRLSIEEAMKLDSGCQLAWQIFDKKWHCACKECLPKIETKID